MMRRLFEWISAVLLLGGGLVLTSPAAIAEGSLPKPAYHTYVNWPKNRITIDATVNVSSLGAMVPDARSKAEQALRNDRPTMIEKSIFPIIADSYHTVGDLAGSSPSVMTAIQNIITPADQQYATLSSDMSTVTVQYRLPIFPNLGQIFVNQVKANPPSPLLSYVPTTKFSGIVIYAKGKLPDHGENKSTELVPSLFPKIWDQNMTLLASPDTVDPSVLRSKGMVAFSDNTDEKPFTARIGLVPFRTVAMGVFGKHATDIIISNEAADTILASPENIHLLTEGRILIIADLPKPNVTSGS